MKFHPELNREFFGRRREFRFELAFALLISACVVAQGWLLGSSLNRVFFETSRDVTSLLVALLGVVLIRATAQFIREKNTNSIAHKVSANLRTQIMQHLFALKGHLPREYSPAALSTLQDAKADSVESYFRIFLPALITATLTPIAIVVFTFWLDPLSAIVLLFTGPLIPVFSILIGTTASGAAQKQWTNMERLSKHFSDLLRGWDTIRLFGAEPHSHESIQKAGNEYRKSTLGILKIAFLSAFSLEFVATISTAILAVEIGLRVLYGRMDYAQAISILVLAPEFYMPLRNLGGAFHASVSGIEAMTSVRAFLDLPPPLSTPNKNPARLPQHWNALSLKNVCISYPKSSPPVLNNVSLVIHRGDKIALVGESGAGKTTLCQGIMRNLEPLAGCMMLDNQSAQNFSEKDWNTLFTTIPQRPILAAATVRENILMGRTNIDNDSFERACSRAGLSDVLKKLPMGANTVVGENGITLSTGQAHRVALARTFLSQAPFIILDEPTAHLDPETERIVHTGISELAAERTLIVISHRKSTLSLCNRVFEVKNANVKEVPHGEHA